MQASIQKGYVLVVSLLLLLMLSIIGLSAINTSILDEKMAFNLKDRNVAFQASEAAMKEAERWLRAQIYKPDATQQKPTSSDVWAYNAMASSGGWHWWYAKDDAWWKSNATSVDDSGIQTASSPRYIVEEMSKKLTSGSSLVVGGNKVPDWKFYYRITSQGKGGKPGSESHAQVMLQSIFAKKYER